MQQAHKCAVATPNKQQTKCEGQRVKATALYGSCVAVATTTATTTKNVVRRVS